MTERGGDDARGRDVFEEVLQAKGSLAVGSQLSLTQADGDMISLKERLGAVRAEDLRETLRAHVEDPSLHSFIKAVFRGSAVSEEDALQRRLAVYREVFQLAEAGSQLRRESVFNFLLVEVANLPTDVVASLVEMALASIEGERTIVTNVEDRWSPFEFLPALLVRTFDLPQAGVDPRGLCEADYSQMTGREYALHIIREVCRRPWPVNAATMIIATLQEMALHFSEDIVTEIVRKGLHQIKRTTYSDLPRLAHRLLLLLTSTSVKAARQVEAVDELIFVFEELNARYAIDDDDDDEDGDANALSIPGLRNSSEAIPATEDDAEEQAQCLDRVQQEAFTSLLQAEGAVVSHFCMTAAKHLSLGRIFVKACSHSQNGVLQLTPLRVAFLLALAKIKRLEALVVDVFVDRVSAASTRVARVAASRWIEEWHRVGSPEAALLESGAGAPSEDIWLARSDGLFGVFDTVVEYSVRGGWDAVVQSLALVGIRLMDTANKYRPAQSVARDVRQPGHEARFTASERVSLETRDPRVVTGELGVRILARSFASHSIVQREVLECIKMRLASAAGSVADQGVVQVVRLLAALVDQVPELILREINSLKDMLAGLPRVSPRTAAGILLAVQPLFEIRADMVDFCVLVFRKALFQRDLQPRLVAVQGLLVLLRCCAAEQQSEIINCVRRCLGHQMQVRAALYSGLGAASLSAETTPLVREMLCAHLETMLASPISSAKIAHDDDDDDDDDDDGDEAMTQPKQAVETEGASSELRFPLLIAERCVDRATGAVLDPMHLLLEALVKVGAASTVDQVHERVCAYGGSGAELGASEAGKTVFRHVCEILLHYRYEDRLWTVLCGSMLGAGGATSPTGKARSKSAASRGEAGSNNDGGVEEVAADDAGADGADAHTELPAASRVAGALSVEKLLDLLKLEDVPQPVERFAISSLAVGLRAIRETRKVAAAEALERVMGTNLSVCCDAARLGAGEVPEPPQLVLRRVGRALCPRLLNESVRTELASVFVAFQECLEIALELGDKDDFLRETLLRGRAGGADATDEASLESTVDAALCVLRNEVLDRLLEAIGSQRSMWPRLQPALGMMAALLPACSKGGMHVEWVRANLMEREFRNTKFCDAAMHLYLCAEQLASPDGHDLVGDAGFAWELLRTLGKREDLAEDEDSDNESDNGHEGDRVDASRLEGCDDDDDLGDDEEGSEAENANATDRNKDEDEDEDEDERELGAADGDEDENNGDDDEAEGASAPERGDKTTTTKKEKKKKEKKGKKESQRAAVDAQSTQQSATQVKAAKVDFRILTERVKAQAVQCVLAHLLQTLEECEWAASQMKDDAIAVPAPISFRFREMSRASRRRREQNKLLHEKLRQIQVAWAPLLRAELPDHKCYDVLVKAQTRMYKVLGGQLRIRTSQKNASAPLDLRRLLRRTQMNSESTYKMLRHCGAATSTTAANIAKEAKQIPMLVFQIEQYDVQLVRLAKLQRKTAPLSFGDFVYIISAWDFQIRVADKSGGRKKRSRGEKPRSQRSEQSESERSRSEKENSQQSSSAGSAKRIKRKAKKALAASQMTSSSASSA